MSDDNEKTGEDTEAEGSSFQHEGFRIVQKGEFNVNLHRTEKVEIVENAGRGKGKGTPTGRYEDKEVLKGHYSTFAGAFRAMIGILALESKSVAGLEKLLSTMERFRPDQTLFN